MPDESAGPLEVACIPPAEDKAALGRVPALKAGDDVVLEGTGSTWGGGPGSEFVVFSSCRLGS